MSATTNSSKNLTFLQTIFSELRSFEDQMKMRGRKMLFDEWFPFLTSINWSSALCPFPFISLFLEILVAECFGCKLPIHDQSYLSVSPGLHWHDDCLRCRLCKQRLDERTTCFMDRHGFPYCRNDYPKWVSSSVVAELHFLIVSSQQEILLPMFRLSKKSSTQRFDPTSEIEHVSRRMFPMRSLPKMLTDGWW